jgi:hypothetical protein
MIKKFCLFLIVISLFMYILSYSIFPVITDTLYIGQPLSIELDFSDFRPDRIHILGERSTAQIEILDILEHPTREWQYLLRIAAFDTGYIHTERIPIYLFSEGRADTVFVEPFTINVRSALPEGYTSADLRDIAPPRAFNLMFLDYLLPSLLILLLVALLIFLLKIRKKKEVQAVEYIDTRPPWQIAMELLKVFKQKGLLQKGEYLEYYFDLSMIFRIFLELQFKFKAAEMTTYEIKQNLAEIEHKAKIINILSDMDMVKFAKGVPDITEAEAALSWIENYMYSFSQTTDSRN